MMLKTRATLEQIATLCQLSISNETLGKVLREMFSRGELSESAGEVTQQGINLLHDDGLRVESEYHKNTGGNINATLNHNSNSHKPVIIEVKVGEKRSTVSLPFVIFNQLVSYSGNELQARKTVRDLAKAVPSDAKKISAWIQGQVINLLSK